jgi:serine/threonine-protein kinase
MIAPGSRLGPYEITAKLGEGGMGEVYRATDTKLEREVAVKVLPAAFTEDEERLSRFEREAKLLAQLQHPNIASIYGLEESDGISALVMELVEGPTLAERLESGSLPLDESLSLARQIAEALEAAHEKGIVHRDLKPQNIKASIEGKVKVLDFGLAKAMDPALGSSAAADLARSPTLMNSPTLTAAGTQLGLILGTAAYMAPEQARGGAVDKRADIWAFGVVLYEMLSGRAVFLSDTVPDTLAAVLTREIDFAALPAATPPAIRRLLRRCLERKPARRLRDIGDARLVIDEVLSGVLDEPSPVPEATALPAA